LTLACLFYQIGGFVFFFSRGIVERFFFDIVCLTNRLLIESKGSVYYGKYPLAMVLVKKLKKDEFLDKKL
jgi:hypothetical protein